MARTFKEWVTIKDGGIIEIQRADLPAGVTAEVTVLVDEPISESVTLEGMIGKGQGCFGSTAEIDAFLRAERDAWER